VLKPVVAIALLLLVVLVAVAGAQSGGSPPDRDDDPVAGLTLRQLVGQRMIYSYDGTTPPARLRARISRGEVGGIILFRDNVGSRARLRVNVRSLQAIRRPAGLRDPLLVMIDQEGGQVKRLGGAPSRSPAQLGRIGSASLARREGRATAANLRDVGVNVNLAPLADVGRPGSFQARTGRSYSSNPTRVSAMVVAFVRGMQERGVAGTLKHFPGVGTITANEDDAAQTVGLTLSRLRRIDEAPFVAGARAGVKLVMTSTAIYPALSRRPAMFSPRISTTELRGHAGFRGVAITDDINVVALRRFGSAAVNGRESIQAGNDLLLYAGGYATAAASADALVRDARAGRFDMEAMRDSVRRILALRAELGRG
jgi:beta-N-acetylhexosaminidase